MRVSSYIIGAQLPDERFYILMHGLNGSLDKVSAATGSYLLERPSPVTWCKSSLDRVTLRGAV